MEIKTTLTDRQLVALADMVLERLHADLDEEDTSTKGGEALSSTQLKGEEQ